MRLLACVLLLSLSQCTHPKGSATDLNSEQMAADPEAAKKKLEDLDKEALEKINKQVTVNVP